MNIETAKTADRFGKLIPNPKAKLKEQFHEVARFKHLPKESADFADDADFKYRF